MKMRIFWPAAGLVALIILGWLSWRQLQQSTHPAMINTEPTAQLTVEPVPVVSATTMKRVALKDVADADPHFRLSVEIPDSWQLVAVPEIEAVAIYDPAAAGDTPLEQAQVFLRYFEADRFLTLTTVDVLERTELTVGERAAVRYRIKKKSGVANFPNQPSWRNGEHEVTDIRESAANPSVFFVIARNPALSVETFNQILSSLQFEVDGQSVISEPVEGFMERVTLKPFGILINSATSPVQPERFSGYHTGADAEFTADADRDREIAVRAVLDGTVRTSRTASGYGGVMVIEHQFDSKTIFGIYGHLRPSSMAAVGTTVTRGQQIAVLGAHESSDTDGERKHLHFGLYAGSPASIAGYVSSQTALGSWLDPLTLMKL